MQAKDVSDARMLETLASVRGRHGVPRWSSWFDVRDRMPDVPPKVALAKLKSMVKRGVIKGCTCGCRGDFELRDTSVPK